MLGIKLHGPKHKGHLDHHWWGGSQQIEKTGSVQENSRRIWILSAAALHWIMVSHYGALFTSLSITHKHRAFESYDDFVDKVGPFILLANRARWG